VILDFGWHLSYPKIDKNPLSSRRFSKAQDFIRVNPPQELVTNFTMFLTEINRLMIVITLIAGRTLIGDNIDTNRGNITMVSEK
jgi:hypothetical protein